MIFHTNFQAQQGHPLPTTPPPFPSSISAPAVFAALLRYRQSDGLAAGLQIQPERSETFAPMPFPHLGLSQGIMARSFLPTCSMGCSLSWRRMVLKKGRPAMFSRIHERA
jgi:hypothetical protein